MYVEDADQAFREFAVKRAPAFWVHMSLCRVHLELVRQQLGKAGLQARQAGAAAFKAWALRRTEELAEKKQWMATWVLSGSWQEECIKKSQKLALAPSKDLGGQVVSTPEMRAELWQKVFSQEFSEHVTACSKEDMEKLLLWRRQSSSCVPRGSQQVARAPPVVQAELEDALTSAISRAKIGGLWFWIQYQRNT